MRPRGIALCLFLVTLTVNALAQGTAGDVVLDGSEPGLTTFGTLLRPKSTHPSAGVKLAGTSTASTFTVFNVNNSSLLSVFANGNIMLGSRANGGVLGRVEVVTTNATTNTAGTPTSYGGLHLTNGFDTTLVLRTFWSGLAQITTDAPGRALSLGSGEFTEAMRLDPAGNVGIGVATPTAKLHVDGSVQYGKHLLLPTWTNVAGVHTNGYVKLVTPIQHAESNMFLIHIRGYRYVGNFDAVDIRCTGYAYGGYWLTNHTCDTNGTDLPVEIGAETRPGTSTPVVIVRIGAPDTVWYYGHFTAEYIGWQPKTAAGFTWVLESTSPALSGNTNNVMANDAAGTLQLGQSGTGAGVTRLTVNGNTAVNGNITATGTVTGIINAVYQDIAEWVPASGDVRPGTVVVLNAERVNEVLPSSRAYDTTVAGVVSPQPGVILGVPGTSKVQVATTGRVRVRADATRGPIRIGDLLVTGDRPGTAMKSVPVDLGGVALHRPGTVLGKALEPLEAGQGEILVLLSLQ